MVDFQCKRRYGWEDFLEIMRLLRVPGGCPWDAEQTHESIRRDLLEESCEVIEAINDRDPAHLREELGDLLFITAKVAQMSGVDPEDALHLACDKFDGRFRRVEAMADKPLGEYAEAELVELWKSSKKEES